MEIMKAGSVWQSCHVALECMGLSCVFVADTGRPHLCQGGCVGPSLSRLVKFNQIY